MPKGSKVEDVEKKLKSRYGKNDSAVYGTLNKIGLMHGNKPTEKGLEPKGSSHGEVSRVMAKQPKPFGGKKKKG